MSVAALRASIRALQRDMEEKDRAGGHVNEAMLTEMQAFSNRVHRVMVDGEDPGDLPPFWHTPRERVILEEQAGFWLDERRFKVNHSGRRSGKSWYGKGTVFDRACRIRPGKDVPWPDPRFFLGAPTYQQAKRLFWSDILAAIPEEFIVYKSVTDQYVRLANNATIWVMGFDKPARFEGPPWDGGLLDEYADMQEKVWPEHVRPALADRNGWCLFTGVPEGRNHYFRLVQAARRRPVWGVHHWRSDRVLPASEIEQAREDLDERAYEQEMGGRFVSYAGTAYSSYDEETHLRPVQYLPGVPLGVCLDFNVSPGTAAIVQEQQLPTGEPGTAVIGQIWIERNSNTEKICDKIVEDWSFHEGDVVVAGDASGGAGGTSAVMGSDWDIVRQKLGQQKRWRMTYRYRDSNPRVRARVNAVNTRLRTTSGQVRMAINPDAAPQVVSDFEGVDWAPGGTDLDKSDPQRTHITDALGYYVERHFPVKSMSAGVAKASGV